MLERIHGIVELNGNTASIDDANDTTHGTALMRRSFWSLAVPLVVLHLGASAKPAGRADFLLGVERDLSTAPAGDVGKLVHLTH
jgi:hypothetical protein